MPTIEFEAVGLYSEKLIDVPEGGDLVDACDQVLAPIPFSCRSASCGTCHILVLEGAQCFEEPEEAEAELLDLLDGPPESRLACQARIKPGPGFIRIRPIGAP